jgi:hypothetical protein
MFIYRVPTGVVRSPRAITAIVGATLLTFLAVFGICVQQARAGFFDDVARVVTAPIRAPVEATINILRGDDPAAPFRGTLNSAGSVIQQSSQAFQKAHDVFIDAQRNAIRNNLGGDWIHAYDALTASQRVQFELAMTGGKFLGGCMQGQACGVRQLQAAPLAAALRDAYKAYQGFAGPLDSRVIQILSHVVPMNVLQAARITVGATPDMSVPGMLNAGHEVFGGGHAVTIANVIIFSRPINWADLNDWNWLLHELRHVEQYMQYSSNLLESIDGFAVDYMDHYNSIENDAQNTANSRQAALNNICRFGC